MKVVETSRLLLRLISLSDLENLYHLLDRKSTRLNSSH